MVCAVNIFKKAPGILNILVKNNPVWDGIKKTSIYCVEYCNTEPTDECNRQTSTRIQGGK